MKSTKKILVCPLDWGLGHATRCIPVIRELISQGVEVIIAASGRPAAVLKTEFPQLKHLDFPGYNITYPEKGGMVAWALFKFPGILLDIFREHRRLKKMIGEEKIDLVISDNRYGLWSKKVPSVFITHQLHIKAPEGLKFLEPVMLASGKWFISKYRECWIPDYAGKENMSGELSHTGTLPPNVFFIGPLSRLRRTDPPSRKKYDLLVVLSGPEPQRSILEKKILLQLRSLQVKCLMVCGTPDQEVESRADSNVEIVAHLNSEGMTKAFSESDVVLTRAGYSSIMDLAATGNKAILIPTPGQTEQEYLATQFLGRKIFYSERQDDFDLARCIARLKEYSGFQAKGQGNELRLRISSILSS